MAVRGRREAPPQLVSIQKLKGGTPVRCTRFITQTYIRFKPFVSRLTTYRRETIVTMGFLRAQTSESPIPPLLLLVILVFTILVSYSIYQRYFHPLAEFPGPFLASITDLWQVHQYLTFKQPYNLTNLHEKYGPFVRYGPDKLSITSGDAISLIYQKGAKSMPKTEFYDAYGAVHPNVFGMRDEAVSGPRDN